MPSEELDALNECFFLNFSRLLTKDEIKKGSFAITVMTGGTYAARKNDMVISDSGAANDYRVNSPAGEYAVLYPEGGQAAGRALGRRAAHRAAHRTFYRAAHHSLPIARPLAAIP